MIFQISLLSTLLSFFYVSPNRDYVVLLPNELSLIQIDTLSNGAFTSVFVGKDEVLQFDYSLSIVVISDEKQDLFSNETYHEYEKECKCNVESINKVDFLHFSGVVYHISKTIDN